MPDVRCQTPECQDAAFLQSADFFSLLSCSGACIQLGYSVWALGLQHDTDWRLTMLHCLLSPTVQLTGWFELECFVGLIKTRGVEGQIPMTKSQ